MYEDSKDEVIQLYMIQIARNDETCKDGDDDPNLWEYNNFFDEAEKISVKSGDKKQMMHYHEETKNFAIHSP